MVMLSVWSLACLAEIRQVLNWWLVMIFLEGDTNGTPSFEVEEEAVTVKCLPRPVRFLSVFLNLIPRSVLALGLVWIGTDFLLSADNYNDLIFNVVALGFLIEIDNMLFHAVVDQHTKHLVLKCAPLHVFREPHARLDWLERHVGVTVMWTTVVLSFVLGFTLRSYNMTGGKYEMGDGLRCLCHVEGAACMSAQVMGARPHV